MLSTVDAERCTRPCCATIVANKSTVDEKRLDIASTTNVLPDTQRVHLIKDMDSTSIIINMCVFISQRVEWLTFRSGSTSREEGGNVHQVVNFICHENFTLDSLDYDVAVALVKDKFRYQIYAVMPAILNTKMINGTMAVTATGWGYKQVWQHINLKYYYQLAGLIKLDVIKLKTK